MEQDDRTPFDRALRHSRRSAYPPGEFVGQESLMLASEIRALAHQAGIGPGVSVLDLCCGVAGPGLLLTRELRCTYLGVDRSASAIALARRRAAGLGCRFRVARIPPVPRGPFDVVVLLETLLAFADKPALVRDVSAALPAGGRFAFTVEEGHPLTDRERGLMPDADTVSLTTLEDLVEQLQCAGLHVLWQEDHSAEHLAMVGRLLDAYLADSTAIRAVVGRRALDDLLDAHRLWRDWLGEGRVRKLAMVAVRVADPVTDAGAPAPNGGRPRRSAARRGAGG